MLVYVTFLTFRLYMRKLLISGYYNDDWKNKRNMEDNFVGFDEHGRRDIYNNYDSKTEFQTNYGQPKDYTIRRNYDNPNLGRQNMEQFTKSTDSADSDRMSVDSNADMKDTYTNSPRRVRGSYFTYGNGEFRRY